MIPTAMPKFSCGKAVKKSQLNPQAIDSISSYKDHVGAQPQAVEIDRSDGTASQLSLVKSQDIISLQALPLEITYSIFDYLDLQALLCLDRTSSDLRSNIEAYKARCCSITRGRYSREGAMFQSQLQSGWTVRSSTKKFREIQREFHPANGPQYFRAPPRIIQQSPTCSELRPAELHEKRFTSTLNLSIAPSWIGACTKGPKCSRIKLKPAEFGFRSPPHCQLQRLSISPV